MTKLYHVVYQLQVKLLHGKGKTAYVIYHTTYQWTTLYTSHTRWLINEHCKVDQSADVVGRIASHQIKRQHVGPKTIAYNAMIIALILAALRQQSRAQRSLLISWE